MEELGILGGDNKMYITVKVDSINEEMLNQQNYNIYTFESSSDKQKRIQSIVQSQLISYIYNMLSFEISKNKVKEIIERFADYYTLSEEILKTLYKNIDDYLNIVENNSPKIDKEELFNSKQQKNSPDDIVSKLLIQDTNIIKNIINQTLNTQVTKSKEKQEKAEKPLSENNQESILQENKENEPSIIKEETIPSTIVNQSLQSFLELNGSENEETKVDEKVEKAEKEDN